MEDGMSFHISIPKKAITEFIICCILHMYHVSHTVEAYVCPWRVVYLTYFGFCLLRTEKHR